MVKKKKKKKYSEVARVHEWSGGYFYHKKQLAKWYIKGSTAVYISKGIDQIPHAVDSL